MTSRWGASDDAKLISLWRTPHNGVDYKKLDQATVKAVHQAHFPNRIYKKFAPLYRTKTRAFGVSLLLEGHRKSKRLQCYLRLICMIYLTFLFCFC